MRQANYEDRCPTGETRDEAIADRHEAVRGYIEAAESFRGTRLFVRDRE